MRNHTGNQRVYVHVGMPHAGTAYLHRSLLRNRKGLREDGVEYAGNKDRMFLAGLDVTGTHEDWGRSREEVRGGWDDLCRRAREHDGVSVMGHDLLAGASPRRVVAAMTMLKGLDVHVVVTATDPVRQLVGGWQRSVQHGGRLRFDAFRAEVLDGRSSSGEARRFRAAHDLPDVLQRWGASLPPDHVHVVLDPSPAGSKRVLWERFAEVVGFDSQRFRAVGQECADDTLGTDETDLLRRVNDALDERLAAPDYGPVVRDLYAAALRDAGRSPAPVVPASLHDDLRVLGERWAKEVDKAGHPVYGDLTDLVPGAPSAGSAVVSHPDTVEPAAQVESATWATAELLVELARQRAEITRLESLADRQRRKRKRLKRRLAALQDDGE